MIFSYVYSARLIKKFPQKFLTGYCPNIIVSCKKHFCIFAKTFLLSSIDIVMIRTYGTIPLVKGLYYIDYQIFYPVFSIGFPHPLPRKRVCLPPLGSWGDTLTCGKGGGGTKFRRLDDDRVRCDSPIALIKRKEIFLIYKEIQIGSYMRKGFIICVKIRKYLVTFEEAVNHIRYDFACNRS
jgi:hypothetical protein